MDLKDLDLDSMSADEKLKAVIDKLIELERKVKINELEMLSTIEDIMSIIWRDI